MMLTQETRRRNMAYARYQRAAVLLLAFPATLWQEIADPTRTHALQIAAVVVMGTLAGWMHREAVSWWDGGASAPTPPRPPDIFHY